MWGKATSSHDQTHSLLLLWRPKRYKVVKKGQHSTALSSAEAELFAASTAAARILSVTGILRFVSFMVLGTHPVPLWIDNEACELVAKDASATKRLSYITRRVRLLQELQALTIVSALHVPGKENPADVLTKSVGRADFRKYMAKLYNTSESTF